MSTVQIWCSHSELPLQITAFTMWRYPAISSQAWTAQQFPWSEWPPSLFHPITYHLVCSTPYTHHLVLAETGQQWHNLPVLIPHCGQYKQTFFSLHQKLRSNNAIPQALLWCVILFIWENKLSYLCIISDASTSRHLNYSEFVFSPHLARNLSKQKNRPDSSFSHGNRFWDCSIPCWMEHQKS